jgi:TM2 domain-containing membrane protein YozV
MNEHYWLLAGSEQKGPYTLSQLQSMWRAGSITADTLYFQQGLDEWAPISILSILLDPPQPPATPSPAHHGQNATERPEPSQPLKNPGVAAVLSFFFPGLGQIYNGQIGMGILLFLFTVGLYFTIILSILLHLYLVYDAYTYATKLNTEMNDWNA